jgi:hypothetical protein
MDRREIGLRGCGAVSIGLKIFPAPTTGLPTRGPVLEIIFAPARGFSHIPADEIHDGLWPGRMRSTRLQDHG